MIDLHTHFLPNIDDGAQCPEESVKMLENSYSQGITVSVATPHCSLHTPLDIDVFLEKREKSFDILKKSVKLQKNDYIPKIIFGAELCLDNNLKNYDFIERLCIGDTNYILVEFPHSIINAEVVEWLYNLTTIGLKPILAHVDRYDYTRITDLGVMDLDIIFQINASNFLSMSGRRSIKRILQNDRVFVVSSDMHNTFSRPCNMREAYEKSKRKFPDITEKLFEQNAAKILNL